MAFAFSGSFAALARARVWRRMAMHRLADETKETQFGGRTTGQCINFSPYSIRGVAGKWAGQCDAGARGCDLLCKRCNCHTKFAHNILHKAVPLLKPNGRLEQAFLTTNLTVDKPHHSVMHLCVPSPYVHDNCD